MPLPKQWLCSSGQLIKKTKLLERLRINIPCWWNRCRYFTNREYYTVLVLQSKHFCEICFLFYICSIQFPHVFLWWLIFNSISQSITKLTKITQDACLFDANYKRTEWNVSLETSDSSHIYTPFYHCNPFWHDSKPDCSIIYFSFPKIKP